MNLFHGDNIPILKRFPSECFDAVVTDPPYGLAFMGKKWDYDVPSVELWREVLRVLKPGGHVLSFGGTRTYHRMVVNIEDAGFEIRDQVQWLYGSGFPKSHNIKDGNFKGFGTALKPANEPICLARKPLEKGLTVAENVLKWGCGAINVDGCRIASNEKLARPFNEANNDILGTYARFGNPVEPQGRWPANLLLDESAAEMLDAQSGALHLRGNKKPTMRGGGMYGHNSFDGTIGLSESGHAGASRFFYVAKASKRERNAGLEGMPEKLLARSGGAQSAAARGESYDNGDGSFNKTIYCKNHHPTVKPIKLMEYLITLIAPPNGTVLDPFMGSGSTGVAAKNLGFNFTGIELSEEYFEIAKRRLDNKKQLELHETP